MGSYLCSSLGDSRGVKVGDWSALGCGQRAVFGGVGGKGDRGGWGGWGEG